MYAVIKRDGKQYKVSEGDVVLFDKMGKEPKDAVEFTEVIAVNNGKDAKIGTPLVDGAKVVGEVINEGRGAKVVIFKKRRRKDSKQKRGFRRDFTRVRITKIEG
ncbi:MAG: 50S ribosomal protein L21 [Campylobacterales bacterium]|nr:50S ribosomal protein L21 [Campylobacterales bacterium]